MSKTNVSIIIPCYNSAESLDKLLNSIGKHEDVEVIVVDDYSNKDLESLALIEKTYKSNCFLFLKNNTNKKGAGVARNIGLERANGKWLLFADADDYFLDNWYIDVSNYIDSYYDIVFFTPVSKKRNGELSSIRADRYNYYNDYLTDKYTAERNLRYSWSPPWCKLISRELVLKYKINFDETLYSNDVMFSVKTGYFAKNIFLSPNKIYCVTEGYNNSLTSNKSLDAFYTRCKVACNKCRFLYEKLGKFYYVNDPNYRLREIIRRNYGLKVYYKTFKMFRDAGVPFSHLNPLNRNRVKHYLNRLVFFIKDLFKN